jgi:hydrogenase maturation protein HypF
MMSTAVENEVDRATQTRTAVILPDLAPCESCLHELFAADDRRFRYPFITCASCGPRFSILRKQPFARANTTLEPFEPCERCREEHETEGHRQARNETIACPNCGPQLVARGPSGKRLAAGDEALREAAKALRKGRVVALKGYGGYALLADAGNDDGVQRLRASHRRPLAVVFPSLAEIENCCEVTELEKTALLSSAAPIVLLRGRRDVVEIASASLSGMAGESYPVVALPATALQHLLLAETGSPLVMTCGAECGESVCADDAEAPSRFAGIADLFLTNDLEVAHPVGDAVVHEVAGRLQTLRCGRGHAPLRVRFEAGWSGGGMLGVGGHRDSTVALSQGEEVFLSQHIGDLDALPVLESFRRVVGQVSDLAAAKPDRIVRDLHPDYVSSRYAEEASLPVARCQHHLAHVLSCVAEHGVDTPLLGVAWDGNGLGTDESVWGGEFIRVDNGTSARVAYFRPFRLPGGETAMREPRRAALGVLYEFLGHKMFGVDWLNPMKACTENELQRLSTMLYRGFNAPVTSSVGRLFDAVASLAGVRQRSTYEGQAAKELEAALDGVDTDAAYRFEMIPQEGEKWLVNWEPTIRDVVRDVNRRVAAGKISAKFHNTLAEIVVDLARRVGQRRVVLTGGCFQNRYLTERALARRESAEFQVFIHERVPPGDGGLALGQIAWGSRPRTNED